MLKVTKVLLNRQQLPKCHRGRWQQKYLRKRPEKISAGSRFYAKSTAGE